MIIFFVIQTGLCRCAWSWCSASHKVNSPYILRNKRVWSGRESVIVGLRKWCMSFIWWKMGSATIRGSSIICMGPILMGQRHLLLLMTCVTHWPELCIPFLLLTVLVSIKWCTAWVLTETKTNFNYELYVEVALFKIKKGRIIFYKDFV